MWNGFTPASCSTGTARLIPRATFLTTESFMPTADQNGAAALTLLAESVGGALKQKGWLLATAESCTGGGIAEAITEIAGSSDWFDCAFVTYSYESKVALLGVSQTDLERFGAVSEPIVQQMALGALARSRANIAIAVSGIAGPTGGLPDKPVGTVWIAWATRQDIDNNSIISKRYQFPGDRRAVRRQTVTKALEELLHNL
jgi:nicotinamide-nucleotide amidase